MNFIFYALFVFVYSSKGAIQPLLCVTRSGDAAIGIGAVATSSCESGETLVSCGISGTQSIGGTYIENDICKVIANHEGWNVVAQAVCCTFPPGSIESASLVTGVKAKESFASCPSDAVLTGCQAKFGGGNLNQIQGSYTGPNNSPDPPQTADFISTNNECNAFAKESGSTVIAGAQCITLACGYKLECKTRAKYVNTNDWGQCPTGFEMFGCNTYTTTLSLDSFYRQNDNGGTCYVQQDTHRPQYANAICCQLSKDDNSVCDTERLGDACKCDDECPDCMQCCRKNKICEYPPQRAMHETNKVMGSSDNVYHYQMYTGIILIGVILFVLINNLFIGYWCVCKRGNGGKKQYEKCDIVIDDE